MLNLFSAEAVTELALLESLLQRLWLKSLGNVCEVCRFRKVAGWKPEKWNRVLCKYFFGVLAIVFATGSAAFCCCRCLFSRASSSALPIYLFINFIFDQKMQIVM